MATTSAFGWQTPDDTSLVKDGAAAIRTLGNSIDTSMAELKGGTTGQVLSKSSNTDMDFTWVAQDDSNAIQNAIVDAKGDLISATAADTPARLAVGSNNQVLTVDSSTATGLKWANPSGGKILQIVTATTSTSTTIATTTYTDTTLTATITPTSASSTILVLVSQAVEYSIPATLVSIGTRVMRGATVAFDGGLSADRLRITGATNVEHGLRLDIKFIDSPATTSATTYKTQGRMSAVGSGETSTYQAVSPWGGSAAPSTIILMEIGA